MAGQSKSRGDRHQSSPSGKRSFDECRGAVVDTSSCMSVEGALAQFGFSSAQDDQTHTHTHRCSWKLDTYARNLSWMLSAILSLQLFFGSGFLRSFVDYSCLDCSLSVQRHERFSIQRSSEAPPVQWKVWGILWDVPPCYDSPYKGL